MLGRRILAREPPVQSIRQLEAALHREKLSFHFQNVTYESLDDIYCSTCSTGCNPLVLE
jgi:hypothetical protein